MNSFSFMHDSRPSIGGLNSILMPGAPRNASYSFPLLKISDLVFYLNELGMPTTDDEMQNPDKHTEKIRRIFENLAEMCTGITREEMSQAPHAAISVLEALNFPNLHDESIPQINSFRAIVKMMEICGIQDFSTMDLITPSSKRLRRQLSGVINFVKFREERFMLLTDLNSTQDGLIEKLNKMKEKNDSLNKRLSTLREQTAEESKQIATLQTECKDLEVNITQLNVQQAETREEQARLKATNNELKENIANRTVQLEELYTARKKLSSQVVNSPERFRKQIVDVAQSLQAEQKDAKIAEKKLRDFDAWINTVEEAQSEVDNALELMQELRSEIDKQKNAICELDGLRQNLANRRQALGELDQNTTRITRQSTRAEEKLQNLRKTSANRGVDNQQAIDELHKQLLEAENNRNKVKGKADGIESEVQREEREGEIELTTMEQDRADMIASYQRMEKIIIAHLQNIRKITDEGQTVNFA